VFALSLRRGFDFGLLNNGTIKTVGIHGDKLNEILHYEMGMSLFGVGAECYNLGMKYPPKDSCVGL
jgi:hypothetical protein